MEWFLTFFAGGAGVAVVTGIFRLLEIKQNQKAGDNKEKRKSVEDRIEKHTVTISTLNAAIRVILHDRIKFLIRTHIAKGEVSFDDRRDVVDMYNIYHDQLGGNGHLAALMAEFMKIQVK